MRSYPDPHQVALTPIMHYLCEAFIRIAFEDNPDPQVLSMDVIGEIGRILVEPPYDVQRRYALIQKIPLLLKTKEP
ncbi:MAG: hypothetical protein EZS28_004952 [Streblomastix strix]|uniref:Uncharacterized protein n=1 Tax=Streblomastix strix TaxID=222440 RepID=A0A5J4WWU4_9EUKA|nr:MAG: hypothetical protein EZS28_004952 [Streblomastix strix]